MAEPEDSLLSGCRVLDLADEKGVLCSKLLADLGKTEARLAGAGFIERAPAEVVEKERRKLAELRAQIDAIDAHWKALE
jgi:valyl-tRNA synthetase